MLGSSDYGAQVAGQLGIPFSFAHHFSAGDTAAALAVYRKSFTRLRQGRPMQMVPPEEVAAYHWTPMERELRRHWEGPVVKGDAASVGAQLEDLVNRYQVDELMLWDHKTRIASGLPDREPGRSNIRAPQVRDFHPQRIQ